VPPGAGGSSLLGALFSRDLALAILAATALLFAGGMAMWVFERRRQPYFDRPAREALFPAFWWALNLVVNGGFEERVPQSRPGRFFAVLLVISSLFIVSIFVARITAAMTVEAISSNIETLSDLDGRHIATTEGSTASAFLDSRDLAHARVPDLTQLLAGFESGEFDAVVFDGPILAWYLRTHPNAGRLLPRVFQPENYGIALPEGGPLTERINRALLSLRESGAYDALKTRYFGSGA
jgi:polar amino acid transport system substrate-binding protein